MKVNAKITMLFSKKGLDIELYDDDSALRFLTVSLSEEQVCQAFSRLSMTPVLSCNAVGLEKLGMIHENKSLTFPFDDRRVIYTDREGEAYKVALQYCPEGWEAEKYFGSQNSFYTGDDKKRYARCTIRRWVKKEQNGNNAIPAE